MSKPVTYETVSQFLADFRQGKFPSQRLGQAFVNDFGRESCKNHEHHEPGPCLFYQTDKKLVVAAIWEMIQVDD